MPQLTPKIIGHYKSSLFAPPWGADTFESVNVANATGTGMVMETEKLKLKTKLQMKVKVNSEVKKKQN